MARELLWNEDMDCVYGWANEYENSEDFEKAVKAGYEDGECNVYDIERKLCISTEKGIEPETLCPIELTDIEMEWFYIARVEPVLENICNKCDEIGNENCSCLKETHEDI